MKITRRRFIQSSAVIGAAAALPAMADDNKDYKAYPIPKTANELTTALCWLFKSPLSVGHAATVSPELYGKAWTHETQVNWGIEEYERLAVRAHWMMSCAKYERGHRYIFIRTLPHLAQADGRDISMIKMRVAFA